MNKSQDSLTFTMKRFRVNNILFYTIALLAIQNCFCPSNALDFGDVTEIMKFTRETVTEVLETYEFVAPKNPNEERENEVFTKRMEKRLMNGINKLSNSLQAIEHRIDQRFEKVTYDVIENVAKNHNLQSYLRDLNIFYLGRINDRYKTFIEYTANISSYNNDTIFDFINENVSHKPGALHAWLTDVNRIVMNYSGLKGYNPRNLFMMIAEDMQDKVIY